MRSKRKRRFIIACLLPAFVLFTVFMVYPTISIFMMSLYKWGGLSANKSFVGLNNFKILFKDANFIKSFQNSIFLIVVVTLVTMTLAIFFAAVLTREKVKGQNFFRIIFYIPNILSVSVIASIFSAIYEPQRGLLNGLFRLFRPDTWTNIQFTGNQKLVVYSIAFALIWQAIGYYMVMYMSSMAQIPNHIYEASGIDGAGRFRQFIDITLPLSWDTVRTTLTFYVISNINISFQLVNIMTQGGPDGASHVFLSYMYNQAYNNSSYGYGLALGVVVFIFSFGLSALINLVTKRDTIQY
ncbi:carbohydrate ABC transporter permease [Microaceticoccus formicicus]|uniref:carbohydrate ABC transporter permease n=1 Tax=Microaceticoccus formicicus TaxID=3118105 RepID=UPI003CD00893|nr:sugar ABC transporter permease [Peptoniphilaceae bacterium AMB_02]